MGTEKMSFVFGKADKMKYPFLNSVGEYIRESGLTIDDLGNDVSCKPIADIAFERIMTGIQNGMYKDSENYNERELQNRIFSFGVAMLILKIVNIPYFVRKFALAEAKRSEVFLIQDVRFNSEMIHAMLNELFGIEIKRNGHEILLPISVYLKHSTQFNEPEWKLINRVVYDGYVHLTPKDAIRLLRRDISALIVKRIEKAPTINMVDSKGVSRFANFQPYVEQLREYATQFNFDPVSSTDLPPCIEDAIKTLETSQNLSHSGRFMLASFLLTRGWSSENVTSLFTPAPDFDFRVTNYQVSKIQKGGYKCPGCSKLVAQNLCRRTAECGNIVNPLQFRKPKNASKV